MKDNNKDEFRDLDGVIYTPGNNEDNKKNDVKKSIKQIDGKKKVYRKRPKKTQITMFYGITILAGVVISVLIFTMVFGTIGQNSGYLNNPSDVRNLANSSNPIEDLLTESEEYMNVTGTIVRMMPNNDIVVVLDMNTNIEHSLVVNGNTQIRNQFNQAISLSELRVGDIVDIEFSSRGSALISITRSKSAWEHRSVTDVVINNSINTISMGTSTFSYDERIIVTHRGDEANITEITPLDYVTIRGVGNRALSIEINRGHGSIQVINTEDIRSGVIEVNRDILMALNDVERIDVSEGQHRIMVRGANIEPFTTEISIIRDQIYILDLSEVRVQVRIFNS